MSTFLESRRGDKGGHFQRTSSFFYRSEEEDFDTENDRVKEVPAILLRWGGGRKL